LKVILATLKGEPVVGDTVLLHFVANRGGRSSAGHIVRSITEQTPHESGGQLVIKRPENLEEIASGLVESSNRPGNWAGDFEIKSKGNVITVICGNNVSDGIYVGETLGTGSVHIEVTEL
jgi:hypothetical protein